MAIKNKTPPKPRAVDVARWVATMATPAPDCRKGGGQAMADYLSKRNAASNNLLVRGLGYDGMPL